MPHQSRFDFFRVSFDLSSLCVQIMWAHNMWPREWLAATLARECADPEFLAEKLLILGFTAIWTIACLAVSVCIFSSKRRARLSAEDRAFLKSLSTESSELAAATPLETDTSQSCSSAPQLAVVETAALASSSLVDDGAQQPVLVGAKVLQGDPLTLATQPVSAAADKAVSATTEGETKGETKGEIQGETKDEEEEAATDEALNCVASRTRSRVTFSSAATLLP